MANTKKREKAQQLRRRGKSIRNIAKKLSAPKSTVSYWCRDIVLTPSQKKHLFKNQRTKATAALLKAAEEKRLKRIATTKKARNTGRKDVGEVSERDLFMVGLALYWGEGYKQGSQELGFTNSDPDMIQTFIQWLEKIYDIDRQRLILRISINNVHRDREEDVLDYWSKVTKVPKDQFTKTSFIKTTPRKRYTNHDEHFGTLRVKVSRGANLRRRILGSIEALKKHST